MDKNIGFFVTEIAEAFALKTLMDAARPVFPSDNLAFRGDSISRSYKDILGPYTHGQYAMLNFKPDLIITSYSDMHTDLERGEGGPYRQLAVDAAILKACKPLFSQEEKARIKESYGIPGEKPIVVLGNPEYDVDHDRYILIRTLLPHTTVVISESWEPSEADSQHLTASEREEIVHINGVGHLAKLYAIADATVSCKNLARKDQQLNNFYEQTQNGPTFLVKPTRGSQYGFSYCEANSLAVTCDDIQDISARLRAYLQNPDPQRHQERRAALTQKTREEHLPRIIDLIEQLKNGSERRMFRYQHPESAWEPHYSYMKGRDVIDVYAGIPQGIVVGRD
jgi:hypothetical protein